MSDNFGLEFDIGIKNFDRALADITKICDEFSHAKDFAKIFGDMAAKSLGTARQSARGLSQEFRGLAGSAKAAALALSRDFGAVRGKLTALSGATAIAQKNFALLGVSASQGMRTAAAATRTGARDLDAYISKVAATNRALGSLGQMTVGLSLSKKSQTILDRLEALQLPKATSIKLAFGNALAIKEMKVGVLKAAKMTGGSSTANPNGPPTAVEQTTGKSPFGGIGLGTLAQLAGVATAGFSIRSGFSNTVEGERLAQEFTLINRQLAAIVKPLTDFATTKLGQVRQKLEGLDEKQQDNILLAGEIGGGAWLANKLGLLGPLIKMGRAAPGPVGAAVAVAAGEVGIFDAAEQDKKASDQVRAIREKNLLPADEADVVNAKVRGLRERGLDQQFLAAFDQARERRVKELEGVDENGKELGWQDRLNANFNRLLADIGLAPKLDDLRQNVNEDAVVAEALRRGGEVEGGAALIAGKPKRRDVTLAGGGYFAAGTTQEELQSMFTRLDAGNADIEEAKKAGQNKILDDFFTRLDQSLRNNGQPAGEQFIGPRR